MNEEQVKQAQEEQSSHRELFLRDVREKVEEMFFKHYPFAIDPYDDERWMVDAMMNGLRESLDPPPPYL